MYERRGVGWVIEDLSNGMRYPVYTDRFRIGGHETDDVHVPGLIKSAVTLLFHSNGEIWLGVADRSHEIAAEQPFDAGGLRLVVRTAFDSGIVPKVRAETRYPYVLTADVHGDCVPNAQITDTASGAVQRFTGGSAAVLMHLLASKRLEDEADGVQASEAGWLDQREIMFRLWGPVAAVAPASRLHLLVANVRRTLREAGFDPWFLEKRRGGLRLRAVEVRLDSAEVNEFVVADDMPTEPGIDLQELYAARHDPRPSWAGDDDPTELIAFEVRAK